MDMQKQIDDLQRRLVALERFLPLLEKYFAGDIAGTSDDAARVLAGDVSHVQAGDEIKSE